MPYRNGYDTIYDMKNVEALLITSSIDNFVLHIAVIPLLPSVLSFIYLFVVAVAVVVVVVVVVVRVVCPLQYVGVNVHRFCLLRMSSSSCKCQLVI